MYPDRTRLDPRSPTFVEGSRPGSGGDRRRRGGGGRGVGTLDYKTKFGGNPTQGSWSPVLCLPVHPIEPEVEEVPAVGKHEGFNTPSRRRDVQIARRLWGDTVRPLLSALRVSNVPTSQEGTGDDWRVVRLTGSRMGGDARVGRGDRVWPTSRSPV